MPRKEGAPVPEQDKRIEITEDEFIRTCIQMMEEYLSMANQYESQAQAIKNTLETLSLAHQTGQYMRYYSDGEGSISYQAKSKPKMGFNV